MEFPFDCEKALSCETSIDKIAILESDKLNKLNHPMYASSMSFY